VEASLATLEICEAHHARNVCMYNVYACVHVSVCARARVCVCACVPVFCARACVCVCAPVCIHTHICVCMCVRVHMCACVQARLCVCLAAPQMLQWCAWHCAGVAFAETGVRMCCFCCSLSVERAGARAGHDV